MLKNNVYADLTHGQLSISRIVSDAFGKRGFKILEMLTLESSGIHDSSYDEAILRLPKSATEKYKEAVSNSFIALINGVILSVATTVIKALSEEIKDLEDTIAGYIYEHEEIRRNIELATSIYGVGLTTAATIIAEVGDFMRFESKKEITTWTGMISSIEESNGKQILHRMTKRGSPQHKENAL